MIKQTICFIAIAFTLSTVWSAETNSLLRGKTFSEPAQQMSMPDEWAKQSIRYKDWGKNAQITINIDQQFYPIILPAIQKYAKENQIDIAVQEGTCGTASKDLFDKVVDMGGFCCPPGETDRLPGVKFHTLGIEAIPLLVHPGNPIENLSFEQAQQIFQGKISRWSAVGVKKGFSGRKDLIQVIGRLHCKQRPGHWRLLLDNEDLFSPRLFNVGSIPDMFSQVATNPSAIGLEEMWMMERYNYTDKVKTLSINGVKVTDIDQVAKGDYPVYNTLSMTTWETEQTKNPKAQALAQYLIKAVEEIDPKYGIASVAKLRAAGWKFIEDELVGEPDR